MESKHTKEYAEKMYLVQLDSFKEVGFTDGYMKAIEETNVVQLEADNKEMLEVLLELDRLHTDLDIQFPIEFTIKYQEIINKHK